MDIGDLLLLVVVVVVVGEAIGLPMVDYIIGGTVDTIVSIIAAGVDQALPGMVAP